MVVKLFTRYELIQWQIPEKAPILLVIVIVGNRNEAVLLLDLHESRG